MKLHTKRWMPIVAGWTAICICYAIDCWAEDGRLTLVRELEWAAGFWLFGPVFSAIFLAGIYGMMVATLGIARAIFYLHNRMFNYRPKV